MTHTHKKLILAGLVLATAVGYLAYRGIAAGRGFYFDVDQYVESSEYHNQRVRVRGHVAKEDLNIDRANSRVDFRLNGETHHIPVVYSGILPDMFREKAEVVVTGKMDEQGVFQADELLTKCASKYTSDDAPRNSEAPK